MAQFKSPLLIAALLAMAGMAQAQDTATPSTEPAPEAAAPEAAAPEAAAPEAAPEAAPAEPAEPAIGAEYIADRFESWELVCIRTEDGKDPCQILQLLTDDNGTRVAQISMLPLNGQEKVKAAATVMTPLGTLLSQNLAISVDGADPMVYPYTFCTASGCAARLAITDNEINAFKRGNEAKMVVVPAVAPDQKVLLTISLKGFTAAYDAASKANAQ